MASNVGAPSSATRMAPPVPASQVIPGTRSQGVDGNLWEATRLSTGSMRWKRLTGAVGPQQPPAKSAPAKPKPKPKPKPVASRYPPPLDDDYEWDSDGWDDDEGGPAPQPPPQTSQQRRTQSFAPMLNINRNGASASKAGMRREPSLPELKIAAKQAGIIGYTRMTKAQLIQALS